MPSKHKQFKRHSGSDFWRQLGYRRWLLLRRNPWLENQERPKVSKGLMRLYHQRRAAVIGNNHG